jgi:hypothetical protein
VATLYRSFESIPVRAAVRFPLCLEIVLHAAERQYAATTIDVSANGVCCRGKELPTIGTEVTFELTMPAAVMGGVEDVLLHCAGRIVRHQQAEDKQMAAAVIEEYSFKG